MVADGFRELGLNALMEQLTAKEGILSASELNSLQSGRARHLAAAKYKAAQVCHCLSVPEFQCCNQASVAHGVRAVAKTQIRAAIGLTKGITTNTMDPYTRSRPMPLNTSRVMAANSGLSSEFSIERVRATVQYNKSVVSREEKSEGEKIEIVNKSLKFIRSTQQSMPSHESSLVSPSEIEVAGLLSEVVRR